jgi:hypothetical protein
MVEFLEIYQNVTRVLTLIYPYSLAHRGPSTYTAPIEKNKGAKRPLHHYLRNPSSVITFWYSVSLRLPRYFKSVRRLPIIFIKPRFPE